MIMNCKEFLRPTKNKIILTIVLILIFPLSYWNGTLCERCLDGSCPPCPDTNFGPALIGWWFTWRGSFYGHSKLIGSHNLAIGVLKGILIKVLIIGLPISYLISCLIVNFYDKFKRK